MRREDLDCGAANGEECLGTKEGACRRDSMASRMEVLLKYLGKCLESHLTTLGGLCYE